MTFNIWIHSLVHNIYLLEIRNNISNNYVIYIFPIEAMSDEIFQWSYIWHSELASILQLVFFI